MYLSPPSSDRFDPGRVKVDRPHSLTQNCIKCQHHDLAVFVSCRSVRAHDLVSHREFWSSKATRSSQRQRLDSKTKRGQIKALRAKITD